MAAASRCNAGSDCHIVSLIPPHLHAGLSAALWTKVVVEIFMEKPFSQSLVSLSILAQCYRGWRGNRSEWRKPQCDQNHSSLLHWGTVPRCSHRSEKDKLLFHKPPHPSGEQDSTWAVPQSPRHYCFLRFSWLGFGLGPLPRKTHQNSVWGGEAGGFFPTPNFLYEEHWENFPSGFRTVVLFLSSSRHPARWKSKSCHCPCFLPTVCPWDCCFLWRSAALCGRVLLWVSALPLASPYFASLIFPFPWFFILQKIF